MIFVIIETVLYKIDVPTPCPIFDFIDRNTDRTRTIPLIGKTNFDTVTSINIRTIKTTHGENNTITSPTELKITQSVFVEKTRPII